MTIIKYIHSDNAGENYYSYLESLIKNSSGIRRVLEVGGGANPTFSLALVAQHNLEYTVLDISSDELNKAPLGYLKIQADITSPELNLPGGYDLIFSKMLAEHVNSGEVFHRNVYSLLASGGKALHFFPTLYAPPFVVNRCLPEVLAEKLLYFLMPGREKKGRHAKFPAYYSWCRGPLKSQIRRFEDLGYEVKEYIGCFGHEYYYMKLPIVAKAHRVFSSWLVRNPIPLICSFAYVVLQRT